MNLHLRQNENRYKIIFINIFQHQTVEKSRCKYSFSFSSRYLEKVNKILFFLAFFPLFLLTVEHYSPYVANKCRLSIISAVTKEKWVSKWEKKPTAEGFPTEGKSLYQQFYSFFLQEGELFIEQYILLTSFYIR